MQDELKQQISRFVDNELDLQQALSLIPEVSKNAELKKKLNRYQLVSQALKSEEGVILKSDFAEKISEQIKQEPVYFIPQKKARITWQKTSLAVAASLALVAVMVPKVLKQNAPKTQEVLMVAQQHPQQPVEMISAEQRQQLLRLRQQRANQRLNDYLLAHSNGIYTIGASNYQPYARVAGYSQER